MRGALAGLVVTTACLSRPLGLRGDAGAEGDASIHAEPWPAAGLAVRRTLARDVDGDGVLDLIAIDDRGIYVLRGGAGFGTAYHGFVATGFAPLAVDAADLGGSGAAELAVLGVVGGQARVEIHEGLGALRFAAAGWRRDVPGITPTASAAAPASGVWLLDSDGDGAREVLVADLDNLYVGDPAGFSELAVSQMPLAHVAGPNVTAFQAIEDVFVVPQVGDADLVVVDGFRTSVFARTGGDYSRGVQIPPDATSAVSAHADLDGDGVPETISGYAEFLRGAALAPRRSLAFTGPSPGNRSVLVPIAARLGQLDRDAAQRQDLVVMRQVGDGPPPATVTELVGILNLAVTSGNVGGGAVVRRDLPGLLVGVELGDFDHDGAPEIILVASDGALTCLHIVGTVLERC